MDTHNRAPNRNIYYARIFVDALAQSGLEHAVLSPGSRNTPLVIAFHEHPAITVHSVIDERSAAFFALGLGLATDKPAALVCSSGTATANFYPAVIEARYAHVPMLLLTADRPPELRHSGANQTVDQVKMYGDHVLWFVDMPLPEADPPGVVMRYLRSTAVRGVAMTTGPEPGPVHINFPFRKPLEPIPVEVDQTAIAEETAAAPVILRGELRANDAQINSLITIIQQSPRGLIICGPRTPLSIAPTALEAFRQATGYPVFADILSNARFYPAMALSETISAYDTFLLDTPPFEPPDMIMHFGAMPASAALEAYLNRINPRYRVLITENGSWTDANHRLTHVIHADPKQVLKKVIERNAPLQPDTEWSRRVYETAAQTWSLLRPALNEELFDGSAIATAIDAFASEAANPAANPLRVFLSSSLPVRHAEQYVDSNLETGLITFYSNRGASGIDGTISSAFGVAAADPDTPVLLVIGDLAFYHDMNGLMALSRLGLRNLIILLVNNDGGGIFHRLPIANFDPPFTDLFLTPHGLEFEPAIRMYGFAYQNPQTLDDLRAAVTEAARTQTPTVIEVRTDSAHDFERRKAINARVLEHLRAIFA